jgi:small GTP-binding protein
VDWPPTFHLDMIIWDIVGNHGVPEDVKRAYFASARGFLAVADATRPETFRHLHRWTQWAAQAVGDVPLVVVLNKIDLDGKRTVPADAAEAFAESHGASLLHTSAKTDENVERAFRNLAADVVLHLLGF